MFDLCFWWSWWCVSPKACVDSKSSRKSFNGFPFVDAWPLGPWVTALIIYFMVILLRIYLIVVVLDDELLDLPKHAIILLPLPLLWIWIFSGILTDIGLIAFLIGYIVSLFIWPWDIPIINKINTFIIDFIKNKEKE